MNRLLLTIITLLGAAVRATPFLETYVAHHPLADNSTYGNIEEIATTHFHLDWDVDFDSRVISGKVTHDFLVVSNSTRVIQMDAWDLSIFSVKQVVAGAAKRMRDYGTHSDKT